MPHVAAFVIFSGLVFAATPVVAQDEDPQVECDEDFFIDEEDDVVYFLTPGGTLSCTAFGLVPEVDASWEVEFFDLLDEESDEPVLTDGPNAVSVDAEGEADFTVDIPSEPPVLWMNGWVTQGDIEIFFFGTTDWFFEGLMTCEPDPVGIGETVECVVEEMTPGEFTWFVVFMDEDENELDELEGSGTADAEGFGAFSFEVPSDEAIVEYVAVAEQDDFFAEFVGDVVLVVEEEEEAPVTPTPQPSQPTPVVVPQPTRVDTGAGGTSETGGLPLAVLIAGLAAAGAFAVRRQATGTVR